MAQQDRKNTSGTYDGQSADRSSGGSDRRDPNGMPLRPHDEALARRTEEERKTESNQAYDPEDVPSADEGSERRGITETKQYRDERNEVRRQLRKGELTTEEEATEEGHDYPPTRYKPS